MKLGALEAGGTKMVCAVGDEKGNIFNQISIPTKTPKETMPQVMAYFKKEKVEAVGVGCFGPVDLNQNSDTYGFITCTPKLAWKNFDMAGTLERALGCPIGFDTDVNSSVLGEVTFGQARGKRCVVYVTIGTGIGAGILIEGSLLHGMLHPEAGHVLVKKRNDDPYEGICPYHKDCFEGLASGPAIKSRWGKEAAALADEKRVWELESYYIAQALTGYILTLSPEMIILGGGVMSQAQLFPMIRQKTLELLNGYIRTEEIEHMENYIVQASLNGNQGIMGCLELARRKL